jgi:hypothetical protein
MLPHLTFTGPVTMRLAETMSTCTRTGRRTATATRSSGCPGSGSIGAATVVPGHGPVGGPELLNATERYLDW